jgi:MFS family permease
MLAPLIPAVADGLDVSVKAVALAITAYMIPFASLQLVSGTVAERLGPARIVRSGYLAFGAAALVCAFAPEIVTFVAGRALMGAANAFTSPILLATLSATAPPGRVGRAVGTFAAVQTAGLTLAPVLGGALGELSWRVAFVVVAGVSLALVAASRGAFAAAAHPGEPASLRALLNRWVALLAAKAALGYLGFTAIGFLVVLVCDREFGLGSGASGLVVASYGIGGVLLARFAGGVVDRVDRPRIGLAGVSVCVGGVIALALVPTAWSLALAYLGVGCAAAFVWTAVNTIAVEAVPENRAGVTSAYSAFKFAGVAIAPVIYLPLLDADRKAAFFVAAGFTVLFGLLLLPWLARYRRQA